MPPRKKPAALPPLTDADVRDLAFRVKGGDTPRVVVRSGSAALPAGTRGNVIRIGKPSEGEYIVVRLGRDEVPFAPSELSLATRGRGAAAPAAAAASTTKRTAAAATRPATKTAATRGSSTRSSATKSATKTPSSGRAAAATKTARPAPAKAAAPATNTAPGAKRASKRQSRRGKGRAPQPLTVTLRFADSRWTVEAQRGSRRLARAMPLRPGAVRAFAEHVDEEAVREALVETVESCRSVVEEKAAVLRAELQAAEAALKEYDAKRR